MTAAGASEAGGPASRARSQASGSIVASTWIDVGVFAVLCAIAVLGFETAFAQTYLLAAVGGLLVGGGSAAAGRLLQLPVLATVAVGVIGFFVFGTAFALPSEGVFGVIPSLQSLADLARGAVFGWSDAVTLHAPLEAPPFVAAVPYAATWLVGLFGVSVLVRMDAAKHAVARGTLAAAGPAAIFVAAILLGTRDPVFAGVRGVAFAATALAWIGWRTRTSSPAVVRDTTLSRQTLAGGAVIVLGAVVVGAVVGAVLQPAAASRLVVRDEVQPPFDPLNYPAPLAGFRAYSNTLQKTDLFTMTGLQQGQYVRMVSLDSYNGVAWSVASPNDEASAASGFRLYGQNIPLPSLFTPGYTSTSTVTVSGYDDVWLPTPGYSSQLGFHGDNANALAQSTRVDVTSGTAGVLGGLQRGDSYTVSVSNQKVPTITALKNVPAATGLPAQSISNVPAIIGQKADEFAGTVTSPAAKLQNIVTQFKKVGFLSHGRATDPVPSSAGESASRISKLFTQSPMVGDQEQYATAFALMAAHFGFPVRVVMGFKPTVSGGTATITGADVTAWDEVAFQGVGWVPFFPTPDKTNAPEQQNVQPKIVPQPQVQQPPRTPPKDLQLLSPVKTQDDNPDKKNHQDAAFVVPTWAWYLLGIVVVVALVYLLPWWIVLLVKRRRRRRREAGPGDRAAVGAWLELVDRYSELGVRPPDARMTRKQAADQLEGRLADRGLPPSEGGLAGLAADVDAAAFDGTVVSAERAASLWSRVDAEIATAMSSVGWLRRQVATFRVARRRRRPEPPGRRTRVLPWLPFGRRATARPEL
jgi:hypothetical protein